MGIQYLHAFSGAVHLSDLLGAEAGVFSQLPEDGDGPGGLDLGHVGEECRVVQSEFLDGFEIAEVSPSVSLASRT